MKNRTDPRILSDFRGLLTQISFSIHDINKKANAGNLTNVADKLEKIDKLLIRSAILIQEIERTTNPKFTKFIGNLKEMLVGRIHALKECRVNVVSKMKVSDEDPIIGSLLKAKTSNLDPQVGSLVKEAFKDLIKKLPSTQGERLKIIGEYKKGLTQEQGKDFNREITRLFSVYKQMAAKQEAQRLEPFQDRLDKLTAKSHIELMEKLDHINIPKDDPRITLSDAEMKKHAGKNNEELIGELNKIKTPEEDPRLKQVKGFDDEMKKHAGKNSDELEKDLSEINTPTHRPGK